MATRHLIRTAILQSLYEWDFYNWQRGENERKDDPLQADQFHERGDYKQKHDLVAILERNLAEFAPGIDEPEFAWKILKGIIDHLKDIDNVIMKAAPEWPLPKIAIIDRNILRIGLYELLYADPNEVPRKVAINESIELAKNYGGPNAARFINGVLGTVYREVGEPGEENVGAKDIAETAAVSRKSDGAIKKSGTSKKKTEK